MLCCKTDITSTDGNDIESEMHNGEIPKDFNQDRKQNKKRYRNHFQNQNKNTGLSNMKKRDLIKIKML